MRRKRPDKKRILALGALLAVTFIGGTFAYFSQELTAENQFLTGTYDTEIVEEFIPPADWEPGVTIPKTVTVQNKGNVPVVAVAVITESCVRREDVVVTQYGTENGDLKASETVVAEAGKSLPVTFMTAGGELEDVGIKTFGAEVAGYDAAKPVSEYAGKWVHFRKDGDGTTENPPKHYFLYAGVIEGGSSSPVLLESVTLNPKLESTVSSTKLIADVDENGQNVYTFTHTTSEYGYDSVNYKLNVNAHTVQATKAAVDEVLGTSSGLPADMLPEEFAELLAYVRELCSDDAVSAE